MSPLNELMNYWRGKDIKVDKNIDKNCASIEICSTKISLAQQKGQGRLPGRDTRGISKIQPVEQRSNQNFVGKGDKDNMSVHMDSRIGVENKRNSMWFCNRS